MICLDLDGTTITHEGVLRPAVREAVRAVLAAGHHVVVATGRGIVATTPILDALGLTKGWTVCSNGAVTVRLDPRAPQGWTLDEDDVVTFDPAPVLTRLRPVLPDALVAVEDLGVGFRLSAPYPPDELVGEQTVVPWEELLAHPTTRVTLRMPEATSEEFAEAVDRAGLHGVAYSVGFSAWLDINPEGVSKGSALEIVRRRLHVEPGLTVAVGDQRNDVEMLRWAARGVAMGNAPTEVQDVADEVTGVVDDDGLVPVLRSLL
ncbi:HAD family hydrolase [Janibacter melonis]|uniref:HAD family hydrolase n=1 Tax=Janibacter melonis TaxID=262209 RepID=A0A176QH11_9MICO|nr:HAD family hydrolase [Janibacter melonis]